MDDAGLVSLIVLNFSHKKKTEVCASVFLWLKINLLLDFH